jgi:FkbM family methyltransferase
VSGRDIVDAGAFTGDSLTVLSSYTRRRVVSYELVAENFARAGAAGAAIDRKKHVVLRRALGNETGSLCVGNGTGSASPRLADVVVEDCAETVKLVTLDSEVDRLGLEVGFLKADIEDSEMSLLRGAEKTIRRQRPVLCVAIYHGSQFYTIPRWIWSLGGYRLEFRTEHTNFVRLRGLHELRLLAIPDFLRDESACASVRACDWTKRRWY